MILGVIMFDQDYGEDCLTRRGLDQCILLLVLVYYSSVIILLLLLICWFLLFLLLLASDTFVTFGT